MWTYNYMYPSDTLQHSEDCSDEYSDELYHYGVLGMKWGKRKAQSRSTEYKNYKTAKDNYKAAKKAYSKSYTTAHNKNLASFSPSKKRRDASNARWNDAYDKAVNANKARKEYKDAKKAYKNSSEHQQNVENRKAVAKKVAKGAAVVGGVALAAYGANKLSGGKGSQAVKNAIYRKNVNYASRKSYDVYNTTKNAIGDKRAGDLADLVSNATKNVSTKQQAKNAAKQVGFETVNRARNTARGVGEAVVRNVKRRR